MRLAQYLAIRWKRFWKDESGAVLSTELVLVSTIVALGMITGLKSLADNVNAELSDLGSAIHSVSQTYCFNGLSANGTSGSSVIAKTSGSSFTAPAYSAATVGSAAASLTPQNFGVSVAMPGQ
jgi:Flp pilus assembly pilin Flp